VTSPGKGNARRGASGDRRRPFAPAPGAARHPDVDGWLWGPHAVEAALANPARTGLRRLLAIPARAPALETIAGARGVRVERAEPHEIARRLPPGAVHQGVALLADPLEPVTVETLAEPAEGILVLLDQVADPQNVGAVFRSAAAFGAKGIILQERRAPALTGALAKAAAGAVDKVACARAVNLSRALETLEAAGWRAVGLAGDAGQALEDTLDGGPCVLVLGSEGEGLRRLVSEHCDVLASIPMPGGMESLNVATAAAIALYEAARARRRR
jgi:23S rRNA (guanosine2251-2'-O)-methyltransferase